MIIIQKFKIFALGGLNEYGKNLYCVLVNNDIFIFDAGLKYPTKEMYGIDCIIPDFSVLISAKKRIKGIFLTTPHEEHIGAMSYILEKMPDIDVYANKFTLEMLKENLTEDGIDFTKFKLNEILENEVLNFGENKVGFFYTTSQLPESLGVYLETKDGIIVYTSNFSFQTSNSKLYNTNYNKLSNLANKKIIALLVESVGLGSMDLPNTQEKYERKLDTLFKKAKSRLIFSFFSSDIKKMQDIINLSVKFNKKIAIIGKKGQKFVQKALNLGYLKIPKQTLQTLKYIDNINKNNDSDLVVIVTGPMYEPYYTIEKMCNKTDKLIHIEKNDTVVLLTKQIPGTEKMMARTLDTLYRTDCEKIIYDSKIIKSPSASSQDIQILINILKPKFVIPVIGEFQHQVKLKHIASYIGFNKDNVILLENGDVFNITENNTNFVSKKDIRADEVYVDGSPILDKNEDILKERSLLAEDGFLQILIKYNENDKIIEKIKLITRGFIPTNDEKNEVLREKIEEIVNTLFTMKKGYLNFTEIEKNIKNQVNRFVYQISRKAPIIIPVIFTEKD